MQEIGGSGEDTRKMQLTESDLYISHHSSSGGGIISAPLNTCHPREQLVLTFCFWRRDSRQLAPVMSGRDLQVIVQWLVAPGGHLRENASQIMPLHDQKKIGMTLRRIALNWNLWWDYSPSHSKDCKSSHVTKCPLMRHCMSNHKPCWWIYLTRLHEIQ